MSRRFLFGVLEIDQCFEEYLSSRVPFLQRSISTSTSFSFADMKNQPYHGIIISVRGSSDPRCVRMIIMILQDDNDDG